MLSTIIRKEILNNLLNLRFNLAYVLTAFLLIGSFSIMYSDFLKEHRTFSANRAIYDQEWRGQTRQWDYLWQAKRISREPPVTKILATGAERDPDARADIAPEFTPYFQGDFKRNPMTNLFPSVDMAFIVGVILTLLIFVLGFDAISGEREEGTLKVLLAGPVPRDLVVMGKWIGGYVSVMIPYALSCVCMACILLMTTTVHLTPDDWMRIALMCMICALYIAVIFSLSIWISALFKSSSTGMLVLLLVWVSGVIVVPALSAPLSYLWTSPPGVQKLQYTQRRLGTVNWGIEDSIRDATVKKKFGDRKPEALSPTERKEYADIMENFFQTFLRDYIKGPMIAEGQAVDRVEQRVFARARAMSLLSPFGCLQHCLVGLARTGIDHDMMLRRGVERYGTESMNYAIEAVNAPSESVDTDLAPVYTPGRVRLGESVARCLPEIGILVLMGLVFFVGAYISFLRLDVL